MTTPSRYLVSGGGGGCAFERVLWASAVAACFVVFGMVARCERASHFPIYLSLRHSLLNRDSLREARENPIMTSIESVPVRVRRERDDFSQKWGKMLS